MVEAVDGLASGSPRHCRSRTTASPTPRRSPKQEAVIDWTGRPSRSTGRCAFNPWPVAETTWRGRQLRIWSGRPVDLPADGAAPGGVLSGGRDRLQVATGAGTYEVTRVQLAGRNALSAPEFLRASTSPASASANERRRHPARVRAAAARIVADVIDRGVRWTTCWRTTPSRVPRGDCCVRSATARCAGTSGSPRCCGCCATGRRAARAGAAGVARGGPGAQNASGEVAEHAAVAETVAASRPDRP